MTGVAALTEQSAGAALLVSAVLDGFAAVGRRRRPRGTAAGSLVLSRVRAFAASAAMRYDAGAGGRRLAERLDAASVDVRPARWRAGQAAAALPATAIVTLAGVPLAWALGVASLLVRAGPPLLLRGRRDRRDDELIEAAAILARHLATELASGSAAAEALATLPRARDTPAEWRLSRIAAAASARLGVGEPISHALHRAIAELPRGRGRASLALLATELELVVDRGCGTAVLTRLASGIEERRQTVGEVRASTAEIRMATVAIPAMATAVATLLVLSDQSAAAAALSPIGATVGLGLGGVAACAVVVARRVTSPWDAGERR